MRRGQVKLLAPNGQPRKLPVALLAAGAEAMELYAADEEVSNGNLQHGVSPGRPFQISTELPRMQSNDRCRNRAWNATVVCHDNVQAKVLMQQPHAYCRRLPLHGYLVLMPGDAEL